MTALLARPAPPLILRTASWCLERATDLPLALFHHGASTAPEFTFGSANLGAATKLVAPARAVPAQALAPRIFAPHALSSPALRTAPVGPRTPGPIMPRTFTLFGPGSHAALGAGTLAESLDDAFTLLRGHLADALTHSFAKLGVGESFACPLSHRVLGAWRKLSEPLAASLRAARSRTGPPLTLESPLHTLSPLDVFTPARTLLFLAPLAPHLARLVLHGRFGLRRRDAAQA